MLAGWMSPMASLLQSKNSPSIDPLSDGVISWMASLNSLTAIFAVPFFSWLADKYGRKAAVVVLAIPQGISWCLKFYPTSATCLLLSRAVFGLSAGGCFVIPPTYVREISEDRLRGTLGSLLMLFQNLGILLIYIMGGVMTYYQIIWVLFALPFIHSAISLWLLPETPSFSMKNGNDERAQATLAWLRRRDKSDKALLHEVELMIQEDQEGKSCRKVSFSAIWSNRAHKRAFIISLVLIFVQAAGGAFAVITYAGTILAGSSLDANIQAIAVAVVLLLGAAFSMVFVERFGRKMLLTISCFLIGFSMLGLAIALTMKEYKYIIPEWVPIASLVVAIFSYGFGTSPLPYVIMSELFSFQLRATLTGCVTFYAWILSFLTLLFFKPMMQVLGLQTLFYGFAAVNIFGMFFTMMFVPETKGKSLHDIEIELQGKNKKLMKS